MLIGIVGFAGCGKGTMGESLVRNHGYVSDSFAAPLKDATASIFGWDRAMLEGDTKESRFWRERPDRFWSQEFGDHGFSPRKALQVLGTDACRHILGDSIWVASLVKRWQDAGQPDTVVTDVRFMNEVEAIKALDGKIVRIKRGPDPKWYQTVLFANKGHADEEEMAQIEQLRVLDNIPHESETAWIGCHIDINIVNEAEIHDLETAIADYVGGLTQFTLNV